MRKWGGGGNGTSKSWTNGVQKEIRRNAAASDNRATAPQARHAAAPSDRAVGRKYIIETIVNKTSCVQPCPTSVAEPRKGKQYDVPASSTRTIMAHQSCILSKTWESGRQGHLGCWQATFQFHPYKPSEASWAVPHPSHVGNRSLCLNSAPATPFRHRTIERRRQVRALHTSGEHRRW